MPDQGLAELFDVIVNSYEYRTTDKAQLWAAAFRQLGTGTAPAYCSRTAPGTWRSASRWGGQAHRYAGDDELEAWLEAEPGWDRMDDTPGRAPDEPR